MFRAFRNTGTLQKLLHVYLLGTGSSAHLCDSKLYEPKVLLVPCNEQSNSSLPPNGIGGESKLVSLHTLPLLSLVTHLYPSPLESEVVS